MENFSYKTFIAYKSLQVKSIKNDSNHYLYKLGSVHKQFTATVILKLQEEGKLSVQDKLRNIFSTVQIWRTDITLENFLTQYFRHL
jgi:CubicO group peptidase (beta-lactamase class C family)